MKTCWVPHQALRLSTVTALGTAPRRQIRPPSGFDGYLSRREAAAVLGLASEFKIRQFEREGRLHPVRGVMGSAWYARAEVMALRPALGAREMAVGPGYAVPGRRRWADAELLALLRQGQRTVVDLIVDAGISIVRAQRVYRFWLTHDEHPLAQQWRDPGRLPASRPPPAPASESSGFERRSPDRLTRGALIRQLRDPDPRVRAAAFEALRPASQK